MMNKFLNFDRAMIYYSDDGGRNKMYKITTETFSETFLYREDLISCLFEMVRGCNAKSYEKEYYFAASLANKEKSLSKKIEEANALLSDKILKVEASITIYEHCDESGGEI